MFKQTFDFIHDFEKLFQLHILSKIKELSKKIEIDNT